MQLRAGAPRERDRLTALDSGHEPDDPVELDIARHGQAKDPIEGVSRIGRSIRWHKKFEAASFLGRRTLGVRRHQRMGLFELAETRRAQQVDPVEATRELRKRLQTIKLAVLDQSTLQENPREFQTFHGQCIDSSTKWTGRYEWLLCGQVQHL